MKDVKDQLQRIVAPGIKEAVLSTLSENKERLTKTLIDKIDEWKTSFREIKAEAAMSRMNFKSLTKKHDKSKKEKLSAETELVQYQLRIDGIPEATKDRPDSHAIKQEFDNAEIGLEFLEESPKILKTGRLEKNHENF